MKELMKNIMNENLVQMIISNPKQGEVLKIKIRPVFIQDQLVFQKTEYIGTKVFHENLEQTDAQAFAEKVMMEQFKQCQIETETEQISVLVSKKGKVTIKRKKLQNACKNAENTKERLMHNRKKKYLLPEGEPVPFLVDLGVMGKDGKIHQQKYDKYKQINRFLEFIDDIVPKLPEGRELTIIDFGCGKSYLTFAIYYYLHEKMGFDIRMIGLDLKDDVIKICNDLAAAYGYQKLEFKRGDIADFNDVDSVDMVVTLHACDTATDLALLKAVSWGANVILSVPCCQHEINGQIKSEFLAPILEYGILKERLSAIITDGLRCQKLKEEGYDTQILEFIEMEHTPKNLLIRAVKEDKQAGAAAKKKADKQKMAVQELIEKLHIDPTIYR